MMSDIRPGQAAPTADRPKENTADAPLQAVTEALRQSPLLEADETTPACEPLPASGSARRYFRFRRADGGTFLGVYHADAHENAAYLDFSRQFTAKALPVPRVLHRDTGRPVYFVEDAGENVLYDWLQRLKNRLPATEETDKALRTIYRRVIDRLIGFQYEGGHDFDYRAAYPYEAFDENAIYADLNYFKYYFLKLSGTPFDERALEADFRKLTAWLAAVPRDVFMCRDFQSRNILLGKPLPDASAPADALQAFAETVPLTFIDFQGGRRGPAAYDLATLLYEAKANLSPALREDLLHYYITCTAAAHPYAAGRDFEADYYGFVFLRIFQAMGAYGLRGLYERKAVFLQSIPHAIANLGQLLATGRLPADLPEITRVIRTLCDSAWACPPQPDATAQAAGAAPSAAGAAPVLTISVYSFSFRQGAPADPKGNGGGFVFDCRGLPNPGRLPAYKTLTGRDLPVQTYLRGYEQVDRFIEQSIRTTAFNIETYLQRGFTHLYVAFACTGGQHRSVYCAEEYARRIRERYPVSVELRHIAHPA